MENQHRKISTCRELSQAEIDLMNAIKLKEKELLHLVNKLEARHASEQHRIMEEFQAAEDGLTEQRVLDESYSIAGAIRWTAIGKDQLQLGLMALTRAVARPAPYEG